MKINGYIEGYYGRILSPEQRLSMLDTLHRLNLSAYLYAPKEDPYHRMQWRTPYPSAWTEELRACAAKACRLGLQFVPALAPGLSFDYDSAADYRALVSKFRTLISAGINTVALLMDDIPPHLPTANRRTARSLGEAHGRLLQRLRASLNGTAIWFCPTVYCDQMVEADTTVASSPYLNDLCTTMPPGIPLFWTGEQVISSRITAATTAAIRGLFGNEIIIWDNYYANDYCPGRLIAGPLQGRAAALSGTTRGIMLNPTGLFHTDTLLLHLLAAWCTNEKAAGAWRRVCDAFSIPAQFHQVSRFFAAPLCSGSDVLQSPARVRKMDAALEYLIYTWKSPLHREWYPFLYQMQCDLRLAAGHPAATLPWIDRKYPPLLAPLLHHRAHTVR